MKKPPILLVILTLLTIAGGTGTFYYYGRANEGISKISLVTEEAVKVKSLERSVRNLKKDLAAVKRENEALKTEIKASTYDRPKERRSTSGNTFVTSPLDNDLIRNPFKVTGRAVAFENQIRVRLKDSDGRVLAENSVTTNAPDAGMFGNFEVELDIRAALTKTGTLEVFRLSAKDGSDIDTVVIPVRFRP